MENRAVASEYGFVDNLGRIKVAIGIQGYIVPAGNIISAVMVVRAHVAVRHQYRRLVRNPKSFVPQSKTRLPQSLANDGRGNFVQPTPGARYYSAGQRNDYQTVFQGPEEFASQAAMIAIRFVYSLHFAPYVC
jgi:hypothetical protein